MRRLLCWPPPQLVPRSTVDRLGSVVPGKVGPEEACRRFGPRLQVRSSLRPLGPIIRSYLNSQQTHEASTGSQQVTVVDLHNLPERAQRFVVGVVASGGDKAEMGWVGTKVPPGPASSLRRVAAEVERRIEESALRAYWKEKLARNEQVFGEYKNWCVHAHAAAWALALRVRTNLLQQA